MKLILHHEIETGIPQDLMWVGSNDRSISIPKSVFMENDKPLLKFNLQNCISCAMNEDYWNWNCFIFFHLKESLTSLAFQSQCSSLTLGPSGSLKNKNNLLQGPPAHISPSFLLLSTLTESHPCFGPSLWLYLHSETSVVIQTTPEVTKLNKRSDVCE